MEQLKYLNKYFWKYRRLLLLGILFVTLSNYFRVLQPQMIREGFDLVVEQIGMYRLLEGFALQEVYYQVLARTLLYYGLLVLLFALVMGVFMYLMRQTIIVMSRLVEYDMRKEIFAQYERLTQAFYKRNKTGDLMARITEDVSKVRMYLGPAVLYGINLVSTVVLVVYSMLKVSPTLTLYALAPLPLLSISIYYVSNIINQRSYLIQQQLSKLNSIAQEVYSGIRVLKSYVQERPTLEHFRKESETFKSKSLNLARVDAYFYPLMILMIGASTVLTVYIGGVQVARGTITTGNIAEFVIYINMLTWPVTAVGWVASIIQQASASQQRINEFLQLRPDIENQVHDRSELKGALQFKDVSFTYPDTGIQALKNINLELQAGQKLAIVGKTGSGKTTIAELLLRMYDVTEGQVLLDGRDLREHDLANLRRRIGYVPQDVFLFSDTVAQNIAFGKQDADLAEVKAFAQHAAVYDDIVGLTNGFDTLVGERGVTLSGGQKQRVSIARALIKRPDILILDDCLSAVDTDTEKQILGYFNEALADKTTIIITHRIYSLLTFDKIIVLEDGRIVEEGTHAELIEQGGYYADMYENQSLEEVQ
ncbi:MAG: ABC transporter ATP-binding protein [Bacteroidetes bacterium]|nr:MAG: ABC transporter ATP-binding protein [Bacteroidota bacterium]